MSTWAQIDEQLRASGLRSITVRKEDIAAPKDAGAESGIGLPQGQTADWRFPPRDDCSSMHVVEFKGVYVAHVDAAHPRCDLWRHVDEDVMPRVVRMMDAAVQIFRDFFGRESSTDAHRVSVSGPIAQCRVALVLVATDPRDPLSATIDDVTGNLGWSHVYVDPCMRIDGGRATIIDFDVRRGVHWSTDGVYAKRRRVRIELDPSTAAQVIGCVRARVRQPWSVETFGIDESVNCVGMVVGCLPWDLQEKLRELQVGPCISPNTLAAFFGVT